VLIHNGHKLDIRHNKFMMHAVNILLIFTLLMRSDLSERYCCVQKDMKNHIRAI
jgi:hypothetical protein